MKLINVSNHPSNIWSEEQRAGFDEVIDIPFPNVPAEATSQEVDDLSYETFQRILHAIPADELSETFIMIMGDFSLSYLLYRRCSLHNWKLCFPATERTEKGFQFIQWRYINTKQYCLDCGSSAIGRGSLMEI